MKSLKTKYIWVSGHGFGKDFPICVDDLFFFLFIFSVHFSRSFKEPFCTISINAVENPMIDF